MDLRELIKTTPMPFIGALACAVTFYCVEWNALACVACFVSGYLSDDLKRHG